MRRSRIIFLAVLCLVVSLSMAAQDAALLVEHGHFKQARAVLEKRLAANPKDADALVLMARVRLAANDAEDAKRLLELAIAVQPANSEAHLRLADAYSRNINDAGFFAKMKLGKKIKEETERSLAFGPKNINALAGMMNYYLEAPGVMGGSTAKAYEMARQIAALDPVHGYFAQANIASHEKQYDKMEGLYVKAAETDPKSYDAAAALASLYLSDRWKNHEKCEQSAQKAAQIDTSRVRAYLILATLYATRDRYDDLDRLLARAEKAVPDNLAPYFVAARTLVVAGKEPARAEKYLRKYLTQEPEIGATPLAAAHWRLGLALEKQGRKQEAVQEIATAVRMKPDLKDAQNDLKRLKG